ncbi:hypothetical protein L1887_25682 [Cichorium endivia]|nr:hypothetical protein L1887_25682 [Cichorium endivia]
MESRTTWDHHFIFIYIFKLFSSLSLSILLFFSLLILILIFAIDPEKKTSFLFLVHHAYLLMGNVERK